MYYEIVRKLMADQNLLNKEAHSQSHECNYSSIDKSLRPTSINQPSNMAIHVAPQMPTILLISRNVREQNANSV